MLKPVQEMTYSEFKTALRGDQVVSVTIRKDDLTGRLEDGKNFHTVRVEDNFLTGELEAHNVGIRGEITGDGGILGGLLGWVLPIALMLGLYYWSMKRMKQGGAGGSGSIFSFGKSKARAFKAEQSGVTFQDVGGVREAALELQEV